MTKVRNEVEGIEVSKEVVGLMFESFSMKGGRISVGALSARGPRLNVYRVSIDFSKLQYFHLPLERLTLDVTILIVEGFEHCINDSGTRVVLIIKDCRRSDVQDAEEIIQGHESNIRIRILKFWQQLCHIKGGRIGGNPTGRHVSCISLSS